MRPRAPLPGLEPGPGSLLALSGPALGQLRPTPSLALKRLQPRSGGEERGREKGQAKRQGQEQGNR
eukprot:7958501-Pyramimonas_sp.AAC.1